MRKLTVILPIFLAGCLGGQIEYVPVEKRIPSALLEPTPISERRPVTYRDLAILASEHLNSAEQANADKAAIKEILVQD